MQNDKFRKEVRTSIAKLGNNKELKDLSNKWVIETAKHRYSYNFTWMGRPIIQYPQDMIAMQEIIWEVKPDLIIETGIAHGGSLIFYASLLELIGNGEVLGIDIDIRKHNRKEIENHLMYKRISMIEGSSIDKNIVNKVKEFVRDKNKIIVVLDSNHTHEHVQKELDAYSEFVTKGSYLVVFDTCVEDMPEELFEDRPWGCGNNPKTAVLEFLKNSDRFQIDKTIEDKLLITVAPSGYLKCVKDVNERW
ncbi:cephalosporin hydroxylase family protein [Acetobacterium sp. K1/6]|uniref:cephalosporin hydroxylase family protein n=1 Tax=Acetobacterium sp. K1/6 TaxID=3055467 RepID=UPI002ACA3583|nr:cephalosporin hydroxylase family protein [Acetobacterium sp. K1/6]MDZ5724899.1 cephalosporin hydroxylase family protein [Acetobacterium sp. K1/6]